MDKAEITSYSVLDLLSWQESGALKVSPKFQRREVWKNPAKGHLIDSILLGYPIPPIHIRLANEPGGRIVREVIDGQQRIRAVFEFIAGKYRLPKAASQHWGGKGFDELSDDDRERLRLFSFVVYQYKKLDDMAVLDMFSRLNTYSVPLRPQELRNGKWFGDFKRLAYSLSNESLEFWRQKKVVSEAEISRMREAELVSELLVLQMDGVQDKKKSLDVFYEELDEDWGEVPLQWKTGRTPSARRQPAEFLTAAESAARFRATMSEIDDSVGDVLADGPLSRPALFYTLFGVVYHISFGLPRQSDLPFRRVGMGAQISRALERTAVELAEAFSATKKTRSGPLSDFMEASARQTDNLEPRETRIKSLLAAIEIAL